MEPLKKKEKRCAIYSLYDMLVQLYQPMKSLISKDATIINIANIS